MLAATAPADAGWWGSRQGCIFVGDPDYMPRNFVRRPYYIDRNTIRSDGLTCHLTRTGGDDHGLAGLSGAYEADCDTGEGGRRGFSVLMVEDRGELILSWKPLDASDDTKRRRIGPLRRCDWDNPGGAPDGTGSQ